MIDIQTQTLNELKLHRDAFDIAVAGYSLLTSPATQDFVMRFRYELSESGIALLPREGRDAPVGGVTRNVMFNAAPSVSAAMEMVGVVYKRMIVASYQATNRYAIETHQHKALWASTWFKIARALRHAYSHDGCWKLEKEKGLPWVLNSIRIENWHDEQPVGQTVTMFQGTQLCSRMINFVQSAIV